MITWLHLQYNLSYVIKFCWWAQWHKLWRHNLYFKIPLLSEGLISSKLQPYLLKQSLKTQKKLKESEIIYQNAIYICISWYSKVYWFPVKKYWCQQKTGITVPIFVIVGYVWQILGRGIFLPPPLSPIHEQPPKSPSWIGFKAKRDLNWAAHPSLQRIAFVSAIYCHWIRSPPSSRW